MNIRGKLLLGFGLYMALAVVFGALAYKDLGTIGKHLRHLEISDDITNTLLEVRRYEKNYLLYRDQSSLAEIREYLAAFHESLEKIGPEIANNIGPGRLELLLRTIEDYERLVALLGTNNDAQRRARAARGGPDLRMLDELLRQEKVTVERLREKAREVQVYVEENASQERNDIDAILRMSKMLLFGALGLIVVIGTIVNLKLAGSIAAPLRTLERITQKMAQGDFSERIEVQGGDEIASLGTAFNRMEERLKNALWSLEHAIEKLREKQSQLVEAEKLAAVGKLAAGIAHEINNPLTSVLTFSNLMLEQCAPDDPRRERLKLMARETERARNIIRQLLNFGREVIIKPERIDLNRPVTEIVESLQAQDAFKGIELRQELAEGLPEVYADPAQIGQVVLNLLLNAIHSITPPGSITVSSRRRSAFVELAISDTGKGIAPENLGKIFDPFFTTKEMTKGTGLGLAVSYGIIKKHNGDIEVASQAGRGTTFTVSLPVHING